MYYEGSYYCFKQPEWIDSYNKETVLNIYAVKINTDKPVLNMSSGVHTSGLEKGDIAYRNGKY